MESATFRRWLSEHGCTFEPGKDMVKTEGHAYVTVRRGGPPVGSSKCWLP